MRSLKKNTKVLLLFCLFLSIVCKKGEPFYTILPGKESDKNNYSSLNTISATEGSTTIRELPGIENDNSDSSDTNTAFLNKDSSGPKVLNATKIVSGKNAVILREEIIKYVPGTIFKPDSLYKEIPCNLNNDEFCCIDSNRNKLMDLINSRRIKRQFSWEDTGCYIYWFPRYAYGPQFNVIDYYYVKQNGLKTDSLIFISYFWNCPDYKKYYTFLREYPFLDNSKKFNYLGNNSLEASTSFSLTPYFHDSSRPEDTSFVPPIPAQDSSSLLIYSLSGFKIEHETITASKADDKEKEIILQNLLEGIHDVSCIYELTVEKLATVDDVSRFIGKIIIAGTSLNSWYIADIFEGRCVITILEAIDYYVSEFCFAYSFGLNNLPDVYVFVSDGKSAKREKEIFYKTENRWVVSHTLEEYRGDCLEESE